MKRSICFTPAVRDDRRRREHRPEPDRRAERSVLCDRLLHDEHIAPRHPTAVRLDRQQWRCPPRHPEPLPPLADGEVSTSSRPASAADSSTSSPCDVEPMQAETSRPYDPAHGPFPAPGGHVVVDAVRRAGTTAVSRSTECRSSRSSRRVPTSMSPWSTCVTRGLRGSRPRHSRGSLARWVLAAVCPGAGAHQRADVDDERAPRSKRRHLRGRLDAGVDARDERLAGRHRPRSRSRLPSANGHARCTRSTSSSGSWRRRSASRRRRRGDRSCSTSPPTCCVPMAVLVGCADSRGRCGGSDCRGSRCVPRTAGQRVTAGRAVRRQAPNEAARTSFNELLEVTGVPCFADYGAIGSVSDDDARYGGTLYQLGRLPEGSRPDVALTVGVRFGFDTRSPRWRRRVGNDHSAGRQRSGGGRAVRSGGDLGHRRSPAK